MPNSSIAHLIAILERSADIAEAVRLCDQHCPAGYVAGGAITQTVWNALTHQPLGAQIKDIDIVYFDTASTLAEEKQLEAKLNAYSTLSHSLDLTNEALTHTWYEAKFGHPIAPYQCVEDAIDTWLSAFAVGVRKEQGAWHVYAPYGVEDLFGMVIRPNKRQITQAVYESMIASYQQRWPSVRVYAW